MDEFGGPVCAAILKKVRREVFGCNIPSLKDSARCGCRYCSAVCEVKPGPCNEDDLLVRKVEHSLYVTYFESFVKDGERCTRSFDRELFTLSSKPVINDTDDFSDEGAGHLSAMRYFSPSSSSHSTAVTRRRRATHGFRDLYARIQSGPLEKRSIVNTRACEDAGQDDPNILPARVISGDTGSRKSFETIRKWLDTCIRTHKSLCSLPHAEEGSSKLPDRVVEVRLDNPQKIRLIDSGNERGRYACLSHCWGGQYPLRTTTKPDTLSDHLKNIEEQDLPKTFRDAIRVIVELGIRFIWIDSLCVRSSHSVSMFVIIWY